MAKTTISPKQRAVQLLAILEADRDNHLLRIDDYANGIQDDPYMPAKASAEYKLLAKRAITNVMTFIENTPAQAMYVDQFRRGAGDTGSTKAVDAKTAAVQPEWLHWQKSSLDSRQHAVYRGAFRFGHSFVLTEKTKRGVISKGLSALKTAAIFEDPANDLDPLWAITVTAWPKSKDEPGKARLFSQTDEYPVTFESLSDAKTISVGTKKAHGAKENPVTRFAAAVDLEGRTVGIVEPMIELQDRINQTVFDLLIVQSFASFKVRTISGMLPPVKMKPVYEDIDGTQEVVDWVPELDENGKQIPENIDVSAMRFLFAEDHETRFGTLDETPLDGFIKAIELGFRQMAALSQTPPHHILGEIANLSAEALQAAETALQRRIAQFQSSFGESWERVFRVAAQIGGFDGAEDFSGEVIWRDMEQRSIAQYGDALGKFADSLEIPKRGLWRRVPGVTATELEQWEELADDADAQAALASSIRTATTSQRPDFRQPFEPQNQPIQNPIDSANAA